MLPASFCSLFVSVLAQPEVSRDTEDTMGSYAVDSMRQPMTATGIVEIVREWEETPEGKRRPSDKQARNENTGMPLWEVEVLYIQTSFGRRSTVTARVTIEAQEEPKPSPMTPIAFSGLRVEVRVNKAGGWVEYWSADGIVEGPKASSPSSTSSTSSPAGKPASGEKAA
jgi:hypothetical protein